MSNQKLTAEFAEDAKALKRLTEGVIGAAVDVHRALGPGLLESSYEMCLAHELSLRDILFQRQVPLGLEYKGVRLDCGYRTDFIIARALLLEIKSVETLLPIHQGQLLSYLRLSKCKVGLLINFNVQLLKHGIRRRVLGLEESFSL